MNHLRQLDYTTAKMPDEEPKEVGISVLLTFKGQNRVGELNRGANLYDIRQFCLKVSHRVLKIGLG